VATDNEPRRESNLQGQLSQHFIVYNTSSNLVKTLSLPFIPFTKIQGDNTTEKTIAYELKFLPITCNSLKEAGGSEVDLPP
jgi:hypothetical protein